VPTLAAPFVAELDTSVQCSVLAVLCACLRPGFAGMLVVGRACCSCAAVQDLACNLQSVQLVSTSRWPNGCNPFHQPVSNMLGRGALDKSVCAHMQPTLVLSDKEVD
jgi:hypothetical protein